MLSKVLLSTLLATPAILGAALVASSSAIAADLSVSAKSADALTVTSKTSELETVSLDAIAPLEAVTTPVEQTAELAASPVQETAPAVESAPIIAEVPVQPVQAPAATTVTGVDALSQITQYNAEGASMAQVTSVSQLSDVFPTDWAFQALQSLVERYGCIAGYPDGTFRGRNFATRYELAAALNACLDRISELLAAGDFVTRDDLATIQRLQEEFAAELATLRGRVDALEARVTELEENQFSTTTKLRGETNFFIGGIEGDDVPSDNDEIIFASRVRLNFDTSFTGEDRLRARLQAGNYTGWPTGGSLFNSGGFFESQVDSQTDSGGGYAVSISRLEYRFPLGDAVTVYIEANGGAISDIVTSVSPFDDTVAGPLTTFAAYNPIYDVGPGNTASSQNIGAGATIDFGDSLQLGFGYLTGRGNDPGDDSGLFNGDYTAFGQLTLSPGDLTVGLTYVNAYEGGVGVSGFAPTSVNAYGVSANFGLSDSFFVGGWFTYIDQDGFSTGSYESEIWTYAGYIGISDLLTEGSTLGLVVGVPPYFGDFDDFGTGVYDPSLTVQDNTIHAELFYSFAVSDNITLTPGVVWLMDPGNTDANEDVVFGGLRTTFSF